MHSDFTVFHAHLAEACRHRKKTPDPLCAVAVDLHFAGVRALDVYRLAKIADELDVSVDWLLRRSDMMELPKAKKKTGPVIRAASEEPRYLSRWLAADVKNRLSGGTPQANDVSISLGVILQGSRRQISEAYWLIARSEENFAVRATLMIAFLSQPSLSW